MNETITRTPHPIAMSLSVVGACSRLFIQAFTTKAWKKLRRSDIKAHYLWMGPGSVWLIFVVSIFVSVALTTQVVLELQRFRAEDMSGALITVGLLRDLGPLTVSLAWASQAAAQISQEALQTCDEHSGAFELSRYIAALIASIPLSFYGLTAGFLTAAFYAPTLGVSSTSNFLEAARATVQEKDLVTFFVKLCVINPTIAVFAGATCGRLLSAPAPRIAAIAASSAFALGAIANCLFSIAVYQH